MGGRPIDGRRGVSLAIVAAASRGFRNMERGEACQDMGGVAPTHRELAEIGVLLDVPFWLHKPTSPLMDGGSRVRSRWSRDRLHYYQIMVGEGRTTIQKM